MDYSIVFGVIAAVALALSVKYGWRFGLWLRARKANAASCRLQGKATRRVPG